MTPFSTLEFASTLVADAERHWLYGHPYRAASSERSYIGVRRARRVRRPSIAARLRGAGAFAGRRSVAA